MKINTRNILFSQGATSFSQKSGLGLEMGPDPTRQKHTFDPQSDSVGSDPGIFWAEGKETKNLVFLTGNFPNLEVVDLTKATKKMTRPKPG